jgi:hypothetical protein
MMIVRGGGEEKGGAERTSKVEEEYRRGLE